ncbi:hypothetical protein Glove_123g82 [Diversispora epigaea]|uniref:PIK helical domain-containing protein n=1 Tax=Diversispora epigaea TaxID=1348612 RepID=A0A397J1A3_9GLOM|nr:hypothetical protein Glove_123g82 [Diversispora epigaea]
MSQQLLLRLFQSEHFNSWMAISYLFRYPDSVGIQHYLCNELRKFPMSEIEFFLPQLCHLLISRTTESVALECFVLESCEKSTHMAILTLWYLQAYRSDLSANPFSPAFAVCKRVLNKCQAIVFNEVQNDDDKIICSREISPRQVRENTFPALVGIGAMLGGIAAPMLMRSAGQIAIAQGRSARIFGISLGRQIERRRTHTGTVRTLKQSDIQNDDISNENNENQLQIESSSESESSCEKLIACYPNGLERIQKVYLQEVLKTEKRDPTGRRAIGVKRTKHQEYKEMSKTKKQKVTQQPSDLAESHDYPLKKRRATPHEEQILSSLLIYTDKIPDYEYENILQQLGSDWNYYVPKIDFGFLSIIGTRKKYMLGGITAIKKILKNKFN